MEKSESLEINHKVCETLNGLTKREHIATMVLQGLVSKYTLNTPEDQHTISKLAIELADTFINEYNKERYVSTN